MSTGPESLSDAERRSEVSRKVARLRDDLLVDFKVIVLRSPTAVAWLSAGGRTHMALTPDVGVAAVIIRADTVEVVTNANEMPRLADEEIDIPDAGWTVLPWQSPLLDALPTGADIATDVPYPGVSDARVRIARHRAALTDREMAAYRVLGRDVAESFTAIASRIETGTTEYAAAGLLAAAFNARGIDAILLLVAGGDRLAVHRHPLPTSTPVGPLAMIVACGRRAGLIASATRFVAPTRIDPALQARYRRLLDVEAAYLDATIVGREVGAVWRAGTAAYGTHGFDADEWTKHHQGGPSGYAPREYLADGSERDIVRPSQAFGWNPSCERLKVEDTIIATEAGVEILTFDPAWPVIPVSGRSRPGLLER